MVVMDMLLSEGLEVTLQQTTCVWTYDHTQVASTIIASASHGGNNATLAKGQAFTEKECR